MSYKQFAFAGGNFGPSLASFGEYIYVPLSSSANVRRYSILNGSYITYNLTFIPNCLGISPDGTKLFAAVTTNTLAWINTSLGDGSSFTNIIGPFGGINIQNVQPGNLYVESNTVPTNIYVKTFNGSTFSIDRFIANTTTNQFNGGSRLVNVIGPGGGCAGYNSGTVIYSCNINAPGGVGVSGTFTISGFSGKNPLNCVVNSTNTTVYIVCVNDSTIYSAPTGSNTTASPFITSTFVGYPNSSIAINRYTGDDVFFLSNSQYIYRFSLTDGNCFRQGTEILCLQNNEEVYRPIDTLSSGDFVKTLLHGYKPISLVATDLIKNPDNSRRIKHRLYKLSPEKYPEIFKDLFISGTHSLLVDSLTKKQEEEIIDDAGKIFITDGKYRLPAYLDERAEPYQEENEFIVYNLSLDGDDPCQNYGIWANGLLVETTYDASILLSKTMKVSLKNNEDLERVQKIVKNLFNSKILKIE